MTRPNIVFYFADQQRWDTCGCYGQKLDVTPNLDKLAKEGTLFQQAHTCQPVCGPARACLQSGQYATEVGCYKNGLPLPLDIPTLAGYFNEAGYETAYVGKWHLATHDDDPNQNFARTAIPEERRGGYKNYWMAADILEFTSHGYDGYVYDGYNQKHEFIGYRADCINNYAVKYLQDKTSDDPFFLFISQIEPHHQNDRHIFEGPDGSKEKFKDYEIPADLQGTGGDWKANYPDYLGQCHSLDYNVGRLIDTLKDRGMWENTILIYTADHGSHFCTRNGEYKRSCHDNATHIPMIAYGGAFTGRGEVEELVSLLDIPATLLHCAGIEIPSHFQRDSLAKLVTGEKKDWFDCVFMQISENQVSRAIRTKDYKYCVRAFGNGNQVSGSDVYYEDYFYDLNADPAERNNLVDDPSFLSVRSKLAEKLKAEMEIAKEAVPEILPHAQMPQDLRDSDPVHRAKK